MPGARAVAEAKTLVWEDFGEAFGKRQSDSIKKTSANLQVTQEGEAVLYSHGVQWGWALLHCFTCGYSQAVEGIL